MTSPFLENTVELGARIARGALRRERIFRERINPLAFSEEYLYGRYRFSSEGLTYLSQLLEPHIANATHQSCALTVPQTVCIALRFFATGSFLYSVGDAENLSKNTVCSAIHKVTQALTGLAESFIVFPGTCPTQMIKEGFYSMAGFPRVLGCIYCTHIPISASLGENEGDYVNRKSFHSLNIQATCDHRCLITSLDAKWPGSVHDSRIFSESSLCHKLEQGVFSGVLLGDRGYACQPFLMTPYPDPGEGPQTTFNVAHTKTRVRIEMTFGLLKARFTCLRGLRVALERAVPIITACVVLHNIATMRNERAPHAIPQPPDVVDPITLDYPTGRAVRDAIACYIGQ
ncbi:putative nuclease HARBI1 [Trematomus bernacchii]|uniref:putative nuclease HARBI1 n=1 Tax=Trematomus bernacchii TaxID=40690 RepID=UPI00146F30FF|nr:putative nuclease HARBI1 [Trematomus bernacchii]